MRKRLEDPFNTTRRINETSYIIHSNSTNMFSETNIIELLKFLIDNIIVIFGGRVFELTIGFLSLGTNCAPLFADLFRFSYEEDFIHGLLKKKIKEAI